MQVPDKKIKELEDFLRTIRDEPSLHPTTVEGLDGWSTYLQNKLSEAPRRRVTAK